MCAKLKEPFLYSNKEEFHTNLVEWIGDIFYDILPEFGYEVRDEQIFTAFRIADAMCQQEVHLAEAGLGTGKTFAYLLSAIPYARFQKKPVVIACATSALQEQLAGEKGDIQTLFSKLGLEIDARMAKDPSQYICDRKVNDNIDDYGEDADQLNDWLSKTIRGERSELPVISDYIWSKISWDDSLDCETCDHRGFCKQIKAKQYYKEAQDLIIVDHETFFHDVWTREERIADGKSPILPSYSAVIFDEGHKIMLPAALQAGNRIQQEEIQNMITTFEEIQGARPSFEAAIIELEHAANTFFIHLSQSLVPSEESKRLAIQRTKEVLKSAHFFWKILDHIITELQIEQELYTESLSKTQMQMFTGVAERTILALKRFLYKNESKVIAWVDSKDGTFWSIPGDYNEMLEQKLYKKGLPIIFTSATLSNQGNFEYMKRTLGLKEATTSSVGSSFEIKDKVTVDLSDARKQTYATRIEKLVNLLRKNGGSTLILAKDAKEVRKIRKKIKEYEFPFEILWEDMAERGYLLQKFKEDKSSVLIGTDFWEGIDVPGEALTLLVIWQLPFPTSDPLSEKQRKAVKAQGMDPVITLDYPEMGLKLKQGCGRLIRSSEDSGSIVILDEVIGMEWEEIVRGTIKYYVN